MNIIGIIAEYNPFHNGHLYHLQEAKRQGKADFAIAVMSGNFVQRGEPAFLDKWTRAQMAVDCGVNLVLELPYVFACNSAEFFARGGVGILSGLDCITHLAFGSESHDLDHLQKVALLSAEESGQFQFLLREKLGTGISYGKAREETISAILGNSRGEATKEPNDILAVEYLKQLHLLQSEIKPLSIKRHGPGYYDAKPQEQIASATAIRNYMDDKMRTQYVPAAASAPLSHGQKDSSLFFSLVRAEILRCDVSELRQIYSVKEGLEYKLKKEVRMSCCLEDLIGKVKSKRYPENRIRRILCHILLGLRNDFLVGSPQLYGRVLAFDGNGAKLLKQIKRNKLAQFPILTNMTKEQQNYPQLEKSLRYDVLASDLYHILTGCNLYQWSDHVKQPYCKMIKNLEEEGK